MRTEWRGWMIHDGGMILPWTGRYDKPTCIHDFRRDCGEKWTWEKLHDSGVRCVRVKIIITGRRHD